MKRANKLIKLNVFVCEGSLSLDRDYLEGIASGKFEVAERTVHLDEKAALELKRISIRIFDCEHYDSLLEACLEDEASLYFHANHKCISAKSYAIKC